MFIGKYLNGKKSEKGKEYYRNEKLMFEGEYLNGEKNRKGKEYYSLSTSSNSFEKEKNKKN